MQNRNSREMGEDRLKLMTFKSTAYGRATLKGYAGPESIFREYSE
jgi:hypothetical protein